MLSLDHLKIKKRKEKIVNRTKHNKNDHNKKKESIFLGLDDGEGVRGERRRLRSMNGGEGLRGAQERDV